MTVTKKELEEGFDNLKETFVEFMMDENETYGSLGIALSDGRRFLIIREELVKSLDQITNFGEC